MLEIHKLNPKSITFGYLDNQILNFYEKEDEYPVCIYLNREQMEQFLDLCPMDCEITTLSFRGITVLFEVSEKK